MEMKRWNLQLQPALFALPSWASPLLSVSSSAMRKEQDLVISRDSCSTCTLWWHIDMICSYGGHKRYPLYSHQLQSHRQANTAELQTQHCHCLPFSVVVTTPFPELLSPVWEDGLGIPPNIRWSEQVTWNLQSRVQMLFAIDCVPMAVHVYCLCDLRAFLIHSFFIHQIGIISVALLTGMALTVTLPLRIPRAVTVKVLELSIIWTACWGTYALGSPPLAYGIRHF